MPSTKTIVISLLLIHFTLAFSSALKKSQTYDEAVNLASGYSYLTTRSVHLNPEHPPLIDSLAALPLVFLDIFPPESTYREDLQRWVNAANFLYRNRQDHEILLTLGRIPMILLSVLLGLGVYLLGKRLFGPRAGLASLFLYTFCPNILAHAPLVSHDIGLCAMIVFAALFCWDYFQNGNFISFFFSGIFIGLALLSKFTALILGPIFLFWFLIREVTYRGKRVPSFLTGLEKKKYSPQFHQFIRVSIEIGLLAILALGVVLSFYQFNLPDLFSEIKHGLEHNRTGHNAFLLGKYSTLGWWYYFPVAFALKTPLVTLVLVLAAILWVRKNPGLATGFWLAPVLLVFYSGAFAAINIGLRYVLPVFPFLFIGAGDALSRFVQGKKVFKFIGAALMVWYLTMNARIYPHYLAYFNELSGGPENGIHLLSDSNLDWGQDFIGLRDYLTRRGVKDVYLSYFASFNPSRLGISYQYLPSVGLLPTRVSHRVNGPPELVAISVTNLQGTYWGHTDMYGWFLTQTPVARIGYSIYVYDITGSEAAHREVLKIYRLAGLDV
ncbi:MAG: glycosyltransferase family 39 protein [bacterium]|nr:glycosyltransferase family 39 protein [bacterium]